MPGALGFSRSHEVFTGAGLWTRAKAPGLPGFRAPRLQALPLPSSAACQTRGGHSPLGVYIQPRKPEGKGLFTMTEAEAESGCGGDFCCPGRDRWGGGSNVNDKRSDGLQADP